MKRHSWLLDAYRLATRGLEPLAPRLLQHRLSRGKEDAARLGERLGVAGRSRQSGPLLWLHGASVGEAASLLPLVATLTQRGFGVLATTGTVTSAQLLERRLPPGAIHQFIPVDGARYVRRFLTHWQPDLLLLAESELWPNLICETRQAGVPIVLINARISPRSAVRWAKVRGLIGTILQSIDLVLAQSLEDGDRFVALGAARVRVAGNLKYDVPAPAVDHAELELLTALTSARPVWIAASTHEGEEQIVADVHDRLVHAFPDLLTIVAPRHPDRGPALAQMFRTRGLAVAVRSQGQSPTSDMAIYLVDTIGDLGTIFRLANIVFLGKSLRGRGGQNPIEPANCGCLVLHGPHVQNFAQVYRLLDDARAAQSIDDADALFRALAELLADPSRARLMARQAAAVIEQQAGAVHRILQALADYLPRSAQSAPSSRSPPPDAR